MHSDCWRIVELPGELGEYETESAEMQRLTGLTRLNVFIGPNNVGKSRLLRSLFHAECNYTTGEHDPVIEAIAENWALLAKAPEGAERRRAMEVLEKLAPILQSDAGRVKVVTSHDVLNSVAQDSLLIPSSWSKAGVNVNALRTNFRKIANSLSVSPGSRSKEIHAIDVYIPALRGLRPPYQEDARDYWRTRTNLDYFAGDGKYPGANDTVTNAIRASAVITGAELYELIQRYLLGPPDRRKEIADFQRYLQAAFFNGEEVTLMPRFEEKKLYVKIGDTAEREIYRLGDGIQQIIVQTFPLFIFRDKNLRLFIEEPEMHLHPGYQRLLIDAFLADPDRALQVFVATHSHQFMDITIDTSRCSVFKVMREVRAKANADNSEHFFVHRSSTSDFDVLRLLGVRNSSVLLSNCTIWVEGVTDRRYLRRYLELVQKDELHQKKQKVLFREDIEFSFVEYSGSNIVHWSFLDPSEGINVERICSPLLIILDSDAADPATEKGRRYERLKASLGCEHVCVLPVREVENLVSADVLTKVVREYEGVDANIVAVTEDQYRSEYLGRFIEVAMLPDGSTRKQKKGSTYGPYSANNDPDKSGTIKDKDKFCERALGYIRTIDDLSNAAVQVTRNILEFIRRHN